MSNVATRDDVKEAVRVMTFRFAVAVLFIVAVVGVLIIGQ